MLPIAAAEASALSADSVVVKEETQRKDATNAFPGLPLMPAGSVVNGIVLPRYEGGHVTSLIKIARLTVESASIVSAKDLTAALYDSSGNTTKIVTPQATIDFSSEQVSSEGPISMDDPRFSASGQQMDFDALRKRGFLRGPVRTVIPAAQNYSHR